MVIHSQSNNDRKYAPPPPSEYPHPTNRRTKDDLHEWSIFRQNVTSGLADSFLYPPGSVPSADSPLPPPPPIKPYGDFQMHDQTVESVLNKGRQEDLYLGQDRGDVYLRFGLPRVTLPQEGGNYGLYRTSGDFRGRRAQSELDMRQIGVPVGPGHRPRQQMNNFFDVPFSGIAGGQSEMDMRRIGATAVVPLSRQQLPLDIPLNRPNAMIALDHQRTGSLGMPGGGEYAQSRHVFDVADFRTPGGNAGPPPILPLNFTPAEFRPNAGPGPPIPSHFNTSPLNSGAFLQSKRHHAHYFSNLDLFASANNAYNYLRYAKAEDLQPNISKQPHLVLKNVGFETDTRTAFDVLMLRSPNYQRILDNITFELFGGETLALMYTNESEIKTLLSMMSNTNHLKGRPEGTFLINSMPLRPKSIGDRVAYVSDQDLYPFLTVREQLKFMSSFVRPATTAFRTSSMIAQLIQTLALSPFHNRIVANLGRTEKQRVKLACQILLDTDVILLDNITKGMDLYDVAFLIDYLRDWAGKLNRIVIMAINPPTNELLAMFYKSAIIASGRLVYLGQSSELLSYFEGLDYPCPLFKNPCDYYVDLVTHDHLTMEAAVESTERIRRLADIWQQKAPVLTDLAPIGVPPPRVRRANPFMAIFWIYLRFWCILLHTPWSALREIIIAGILSSVLGLIYLQLTVIHEGGITDRFGLFYSLLTLFLFPLLWLNIEQVCAERLLLYYDLKRNLYGKYEFLVGKILFDFPLSLLVYICYLTPVYFLAGLQSILRDNGLIFGLYLAIGALYCLAWRMLAWTFAYACYRRRTATVLLGSLLSLCALTAGITIHPLDIWAPFSWFRYVSPTQWAIQLLSGHEFYGNATASNLNLASTNGITSSQLSFKCTPKTITQNSQGFEIVTATRCSNTTGSQILEFAALSLTGIGSLRQSGKPYEFGVPIIASWGLTGFLLNFLFIICNHKPKRKMKHRDS